MTIRVETPTGRIGALDISSLGGAKRKINKEMERTDPDTPQSWKKRPAGREEAPGGKHRTAAEKEANQEDAEARKLRKEQLQDLMFTGHAGDLLETDEGGRDRHLDDLSPADARDMVLRAAALQFLDQLLDMPPDVRELLIRVGSALQGGGAHCSASPNVGDLYALAGLGIARAGSTIKSYAKQANERLAFPTQQRSKHERDWLLNDEELLVDCRQWINRQTKDISAARFSAWLQHGDDGDDRDTHVPILQRQHVRDQADAFRMHNIAAGNPPDPSTVTAWLHRLGCKWDVYKKNYYTDNHETPANKEHRIAFCKDRIEVRAFQQPVWTHMPASVLDDDDWVLLHGCYRYVDKNTGIDMVEVHDDLIQGHSGCEWSVRFDITKTKMSISRGAGQPMGSMTTPQRQSQARRCLREKRAPALVSIFPCTLTRFEAGVSN